MRRRTLVAALGCTAAGRLAAQTPAGVRPLGDDRYQLRGIVVDRRTRTFTVPGRVHAHGVPLEYLATSPGGMKAYETLFELDTTGSEFNVACILIGLEAAPDAVPPLRYRQVPRLHGPRVAITVTWQHDGARRRVPAAQALLNPEAEVDPQSVEWVYTGAPSSAGRDRFVPDDTGTLIGFVHDANTIIESVAPIGLGAYGSVRGHAMLPPTSTPIELVVEAVAGRS